MSVPGSRPPAVALAATLTPLIVLASPVAALAQAAGSPAAAGGAESWLMSLLPEALKRPLLFDVTGWQLLGVLGLVFLSVLCNRLALSLLSTRVRRWVESLLPGLEPVVERSAGPVSGMVIAAVFWVGFPLLGFGGRIDLVVGLAVRVLAVASSVWLFYRQIDVLSGFLEEKAEATETRLDDQLVPLVRRTLKAFVVVVGGIFILQNLEVDVASLVAGLGLGGLAFALAAKDTLANFFGAITIFVDRPFQIGDWVKIDKVEGTVEDVGFRTTRIRTFYNSLITIPNATLTGTPVDNMGMREYRRIYTYLGLTYGTTPAQMQAFCEGVRAIIAAHPDTRKDYYHCYFNRWGAHSLDVLVYCFVKTATWSEELKAKHELFLSFLRLADEVGVSYAFPTQTLHVDSFPEKEPVALPEPLPEEGLRGKVLAFGSGGAASRPRELALTHGFYATGDPMAREGRGAEPGEDGEGAT